MGENDADSHKYRRKKSFVAMYVGASLIVLRIFLRDLSCWMFTSSAGRSAGVQQVCCRRCAQQREAVLVEACGGVVGSGRHSGKGSKASPILRLLVRRLTRAMSAHHPGRARRVRAHADVPAPGRVVSAPRRAACASPKLIAPFAPWCVFGPCFM